MKDFKNANNLFSDFIINGNLDSFDELYNLISPWLYRCIYRIHPFREIVEDILQESWIVVLEHKSTFDTDKGQFNNLIFTIAKNLTLKHIRKNELIYNNFNEDLMPSISSTDKTPEDIVSILETSKIINESIIKLKEDYQNVLFLYYYGDLTIREIAIQLNKPENTIKTLLKRGKAKLENILTTSNVELHIF